MNDTVRIIGYVLGGLVIVAVLVGSCAMDFYSYGDCLNVGHTHLYCLWKFGR